MAKNYMLAQFCTSIRNGQTAQKTEAVVNNTTLNKNILKVLTKEGFIRGFHVNETDNLQVELKYFAEKPVITKIEPLLNHDRNKVVSLEMLKKRKKSLDQDYKGLETFIVTTSKGILSDYNCIQENVGGQILLKVL